MYEVFDHTADVGLRIRAPELPALFVEAGRALFSLIVENPEAIMPEVAVTFDIEGRDPATLLFDWLSELLYTFDSRHLLLWEFQVQIGPEGLRGSARGEPLDRARHTLDHEVKAITYHGLSVRETEDGWMGEVIVDL